MPRRVSKDKAKTAIKEYLTNGFNKTKAIRKVSNYTGKGANKQSTRDFERLVRVGNEDITGITEAWILEKLKLHALKSKKDGDKIRSLELLGKWKALFTDKIETKDRSITPELEQELRNYIDNNRLSSLS